MLGGIPSLLIAIVCSMLVHHYAHDIARRHACPREEAPNVEFTLLQEGTEGTPECPVASLAAISATLALGLVSFGLLLRNPRNVFFALLGFVNITMRLPGGLASFVHILMRRTTPIPADEAVALNLLHLGDPVGYIFILALYVIALVFFALIIVNDTRTVPRKWIVALILFVLLPPFEAWLWPVLRAALPR